MSDPQAQPEYVDLATVGSLDVVTHRLPYGPGGVMEPGHLLTQDCTCKPEVACAPVDPDVDVGDALTVTHRPGVAIVQLGDDQ